MKLLLLLSLYSLFAVSSATFFFQQVDFAIVGGGAAGCVIARRLVDAGFTVMLLEAGVQPDLADPQFTITGFAPLGNPRYDWRYRPDPPADIPDRPEIIAFGGKVLGGGGMLNAAITYRGAPEYWDSFKTEFGLNGWDFDDLLPLFKKIEDNKVPGVDPAFHNVGGPISVVEYPASVVPGAEEFLQAGANLTFLNTDFNGANNTNGFGRSLLHISPEFTRNNSYYGYLLPIINSNKLILKTEALVTEIVFVGKTAVAVKYFEQGKVRYVGVRNEILLAAGPIRDPFILLHSGVGPATELQNLDIDVVYDSPNVGKKLQDHPVLSYQFPTACPILSQLQFLSILGISYATPVAGYLKTSVNPGYSDVQLAWLPYAPDSFVPSTSFAAFTVLISLTAPKTTGNVTLFTSNPFDPPIINYPYVSDADDIQAIVESVDFIENELLQQPALQSCKAPGDRVNPAPGESITDFARRKSNSAYHWSSSCAMGSTSDSVLDEELKVRGINRVRVVDGSALPKVPNVNTQTPTFVVAEKAAELIICEYLNQC